MSKKIKIILVEDSTTFRELVKSVLEEHPDIEVVSQALNGKLALPRIKHYEPDILVLDQEMPEMSGLELLKEIKGKYPSMGVLMLSAHTIQGARLTIKCLEEGAWDFITKPNLGLDGDPAQYIKDKLIPKILAFHKNQKSKSPSQNQIPVIATPSYAVPASSHKSAEDSKRIYRHIPMGFCKSCCIGISTGGPVALREIFQNLGHKLRAPLFIVQHMPPVFTKQLAESLNDLTPIQVLEAQEGMLALPNHAYIAPGGKHMSVENLSNGSVKIRITDEPPEENCKPSVNILFRSIANCYGGKTVSVIMTGMGTDGYHGLVSIKEKGGYIIGQTRESCLIYGMPERPIRENMVDEVLETKAISERIQFLLGVEN